MADGLITPCLASSSVLPILGERHRVFHSSLAGCGNHIELQPVPLGFPADKPTLTIAFVVLTDLLAGVSWLRRYCGRIAPGGGACSRTNHLKYLMTSRLSFRAIASATHS
jgi:hypothetical protein